MHNSSLINLVSSPHPPEIVKDQLNFVADYLDNERLAYQFSSDLSINAFNIVLEGFSDYYAEKINQFCEKNKEKVAVILTEHVRLSAQNVLTMNHRTIFQYNQYMPNQIQRLRALLRILPNVNCFLTAGHLPKAEGISQLFPAKPCFQIPYQKISMVASPVNKENDFLFQGALTAYRRRLMLSIKKIAMRTISGFFLDSEEQAYYLQKARYALNIPQYQEWSFISPMRCIFALKLGVPVINISNHSTHEFDEIFPRIRPSELKKEIKEYLFKPEQLVFKETLGRYNKFVENQGPCGFKQYVELFS